MARKRVLVVEDYQQVRDLIATVLREVGGYAVETAADGASAARLLAGQTFDLLVLDLCLPGTMGGHELAAMARERVGSRILFITGRDLSDDMVGDLMKPAERFLRKPFKIDVLLAEVGAILKTSAVKPPKRIRTAKRAQVGAPLKRVKPAVL